MAIQPIQREVIYLVERQPPQQPEPPATTFDRIKEIAGKTLAILGLAILVGTAITFAGTLLGYFAIQTELLHTIFMTGIVSAIAGFHLAKGNEGPSAEFAAGPMAISI